MTHLTPNLAPFLEQFETNFSEESYLNTASSLCLQKLGSVYSLSKALSFFQTIFSSPKLTLKTLFGNGFVHLITSLNILSATERIKVKYEKLDLYQVSQNLTNYQNALVETFGYPRDPMFRVAALSGNEPSARWQFAESIVWLVTQIEKNGTTKDTQNQRRTIVIKEDFEELKLGKVLKKIHSKTPIGTKNGNVQKSNEKMLKEKQEIDDILQQFVRKVLELQKTNKEKNELTDSNSNSEYFEESMLEKIEKLYQEFALKISDSDVLNIVNDMFVESFSEYSNITDDDQGSNFEDEGDDYNEELEDDEEEFEEEEEEEEELEELEDDKEDLEEKKVELEKGDNEEESEESEEDKEEVEEEVEEGKELEDEDVEEEEEFESENNEEEEEEEEEVSKSNTNEDDQEGEDGEDDEEEEEFESENNKVLSSIESIVFENSFSKSDSEFEKELELNNQKKKKKKKKIKNKKQNKKRNMKRLEYLIQKEKERIKK